MLLFCSAGFIPALEIGISPGTDLGKIAKKPAIVSSEISLVPGDISPRWITMKADVHVWTDIPLDTLRPIARDFENYSNIFKRIKRDRVIKTEDALYLEMLISVGLLNITYDTEYVLLAAEVLNTPSRFLLDFSHVSDDGRVRKAHGIWYFEAAAVEGVMGTYIRYIADGQVLKVYPLQDTIMHMFVNMEHIDILNQFLQAVSKRNP
jgi:hypothetical protein